MGRVHKKKIAEYAESAGNEDSVEREEEKGAAAESCSSSEAEGDAKGDDVSEADFQSSKEDGDQADENNSPRKGNKRKSAPGKFTNSDGDASDSDDEPLNGSGINSAKKGKKTAVKAKAGAKNGKAGAKRGRKPQVKEAAVEEEYEVKDIVGQKEEDGVTYYLIRWKGYTKDDDTWEPEDTLSCPDIIEKYKQKIATGKKSAKKSVVPGKKGRPKNQLLDGMDPNKEWEVEKIIDYAEEKKQRLFRIRWKGFGPKHDTWEPEKNLSCDDIISKFMKRMKDQENLSFKELREEPKKTKRLLNETVPRTTYSQRVERKSKRAGSKKRVYYGDSDE